MTAIPLRDDTRQELHSFALICKIYYFNLYINFSYDKNFTHYQNPEKNFSTKFCIAAGHTMHRFGDVINRVETVRRDLGLTKSAFADGFGMKLQSYFNFVGPQGSKPSITLIYGVVAAYRVSPEWLLNGTGEMFLGEDNGMERVRGQFEGPEKKGFNLAPNTGGKEKILRQLNRKLRNLKRAFAELEDDIRSLDSRTYN